MYTVAINKELTLRFHPNDRRTVSNVWYETGAECYGQKGDNCFHGRWETFSTSTTRTRLACMITRPLKLPVICRSFKSKPIVAVFFVFFFCLRWSLNCSRGVYLVSCKTQKNSLLSTSATSASLCEGLLYASPWLTTSRKLISSMWQQEWSIIAVRSHLLCSYKHSRERKNIDTCACVVHAYVGRCETETFTHWNDHRTKLNVNFLLCLDYCFSGVSISRSTKFFWKNLIS